MNRLHGITTLGMLICAALLASCASSRPTAVAHYALVERNDVIASDSSIDVGRLQALRSASDADFVWFDRNGSQYTTTDADTVRWTRQQMVEIQHLLRGQSAGHGEGNWAIQQVHITDPPNTNPFDAGANYVFSPFRAVDQVMDSTRSHAANADSVKGKDRDIRKRLDDSARNGAARPLH